MDKSQATGASSTPAAAPVSLATETLPRATETLATKGETEKVPSNPEASRELWSDAHGQFAYFLHLYIRDFIKFADQKAAFILALASAILAFLVRQGAHKSLLAPIGNRNFSDWSAFFACFLISSTSLLALLVVLPRLSGKRTGVVYWGAFLQSGGASAYKATLQPLDGNRLVSEILEHCYELAEIADRKYELLKWATWLGALGAIAAAFVLLRI
jgi:hypothetical protein